MLDKNLKKLQSLLATLDEDNLTKTDFAESFADVVTLIKKIEQKNAQEFEAMNKLVADLSEHLKAKTDSSMEMSKGEMMGYCKAEIDKMLKAHEAKMSEADMKMMEVKDGLDADIDLIARKASDLAIVEVLKAIPTIEAIENDLPKLGASVASALELLPDGEKLKIEAIEGLQELLDEVKNRKVMGSVGGGGFSKMAMDQHFADDETPTGDVNGVNKDFILSHAPAPISSLKVFRAGGRQRTAEDYTFSGKTISFIVAPVAGEIILCDYRF